MNLYPQYLSMSKMGHKCIAWSTVLLAQPCGSNIIQVGISLRRLSKGWTKNKPPDSRFLRVCKGHGLRNSANLNTVQLTPARLGSLQEACLYRNFLRFCKNQPLHRSMRRQALSGIRPVNVPDARRYMNERAARESHFAGKFETDPDFI